MGFRLEWKSERAADDKRDQMIMKTRSRSRELGNLSNAVCFNMTIMSAHAQ